MLKFLRAPLVCVFFAAAAACAADGQPGADVIETLKTDGHYRMLLSLLDDAQFTPVLKVTGAVTLFAPTDDAFLKLPDLAAFLGDKPRVKATLARHFVADRKIISEELSKTNALVMSDGGTVRISEEGKRIANAQITGPEIAAGNGVIYGIDQVLIVAAPQQLSEVRITESTATPEVASVTTETTVTTSESKGRLRDAGDTVGGGLKNGANKIGDGLKSGAGKIKHVFGF